MRPDFKLVWRNCNSLQNVSRIPETPRYVGKSTDFNAPSHKLPKVFPMAHYDTFDQAIDDGKAVSAVYDGEGSPRKLIPYVLGDSEIPDSEPVDMKNMVLCYEYTEGDSSDHPSEYYWRCFEVDLFDSVTPVDFSEQWLPPKMTGRERNRQNCVQNINNHRRPNQ